VKFSELFFKRSQVWILSELEGVGDALDLREETSLLVQNVREGSLVKKVLAEKCAMM